MPKARLNWSHQQRQRAALQEFRVPLALLSQFDDQSCKTVAAIFVAVILAKAKFRARALIGSVHRGEVKAVERIC